MTKNYKEIMQEIIERLQEMESPNLINVVNAFNLAEKLHNGQFRKSGEPYILHPVCVAKILCELDFDTDVIASALLHDVLEDTDCTFEFLEKNFNPNIAQIVDAVTAINENQQDLESIFLEPNFHKQARSEQTFQKLINIGKENKFAFFIKFADRLHNLQTIGVFDEYKQLAKVKETMSWVIPLAYLLRTRYFYEALQNECFKITNRHKIEEFEYRYHYYQEGNKKAYKELERDLTHVVQNFLASNNMSGTFKKVVFEQENLFNTYEQIKQNLDVSKFNQIKRNSFGKVPNVKIYLIFNGKFSDKKLNDIFFDLFEEKLSKKFFTFVGFENDDIYNTKYYIVKDSLRIKYRLCLMTMEKFLLIRNGTTQGTDIDFIDEEDLTSLTQNFITIKTRSNKTIKMPEGSTVLDFAFKIHKDLGLSCKYAVINKSPVKYQLHTKLADGDQVEIFNEIDEKSGLAVPIAKLRWLAYVNTDNAKKVLIKFLEKKFDAIDNK